MYDIEDYDYDLPEQLIAQVPASERDKSRLLFLERSRKSLSDRFFFELPRLLEAGDILVVNNTRVVPARIFGRKQSGGRVEVLVLEHPGDTVPDGDTVPYGDIRWCLLRSSKRPQKGSRLFFDNQVQGVVRSLGDDGLVQISFEGPQPLDFLIEERGTMPLPPYIRRLKEDGLAPIDRERYQTVFAKRVGAVACPTAGLHFTAHLIGELIQAGVSLVPVTLHVGHGTFKPVRVQDIRQHHLGEEAYTVDQETADAVNTAKREGRRVIAVGTTVVRTLETLGRSEGRLGLSRGRTDLFITPGFEFNVIDGLITNFHLPRSSLLFLVSAFSGVELTRKAYEWAVAKAYRFYSYGDAMLII